MSTDRIAKSGPTCPYSTLPGFVRATRLLLGILSAVAFATALAGCQLVPTDLSDSPITSTPASDRATTGSREFGVPGPQTQVQMVDEVSVSDDLPDICQEVRDMDQMNRCLDWYEKIGSEVHRKKKIFHDFEFDRHIGLEDRNLKNYFSIIRDMKQDNFDENMLIENVSIGLSTNNKNELNQFTVFLFPPSFWGEIYFDPNTLFSLKNPFPNEEKHKESLDKKDIVISVNILASRYRKNIKLSPPLIIGREILLSYEILDFKNNQAIEGIFLKLYDAKEKYSDGKPFEASWIVVPVQDIISHFLDAPPEQKRIRKIESDRKTEFGRIDDRNKGYADKMLDCRSNRYFEAGTNASDEDILNPEQLMKRIVHISVPTSSGTGFGTGFYVDDNLVMTNHHVISNLRTDTTSVDIEKLGKDGKFSGTVVGYDSRRDLALLRVEEMGAPFPIYIGAVPPRGVVVSAFGHPRNIRWIYTRGVVSGYVPSRDRTSLVVTDAAINKGNSGGPLVYAGKVIGVNRMMQMSELLDPTEGLNYAVRYDEIHAFLRQQGLDLFKEPGQIVHDEEAILKCLSWTTDAQQPSR